MGLFSAPKVTTPEPPKAPSPAPKIDTTTLASRNQNDQLKKRFGLGETSLSLGRPRTAGAATALGRSGSSGYSQAA